MKQTFKANTFKSKTFASGNWQGIGVAPPTETHLLPGRPSLLRLPGRASVIAMPGRPSIVPLRETG